MDVEERMKMLLSDISQQDMSGGTFAERAEWYYHRRPQLLSLLQDLYNGYTSLLDRNRKQRPFVTIDPYGSHFDLQDQDVDWDAESSLSYQNPPTSSIQNGIFTGIDEMVADLVIKNVEKDILQEQVTENDQKGYESCRKIDLLKKLLEVLDSERIVLLNENVRLEYKVAAVLEENRELSSEATFLRRKGAELARCLVKMREDHRVFVLNRKIEDLQQQIYGLEKRNKEYYEQLVKVKVESDRDERKEKEKKNDGHLHLDLMGCFQLEKLKLKERNVSSSNNGGAKRSPRWWGKMKGIDLLSCGLHQCRSA